FAMSRVYIYVILGAVSYGFFHLIAFLVTYFWGNIYDPRAMTVGIPISIVFVAVFLPIVEKIKYSSDIFFFKGYNPKKIIKDLIIKLSKIVKLEELYEILSEEIRNVLNVEDMSVLVIEEDKENKSQCISQSCSLNYKPIKENGQICQKAKEKKEIIVRDELGLSQKKLKQEMDKHSAKVIVPLLHKDKLRGIIIIGEKENNGGFSREDLEFLEVFQPQISLILENILLYREIKDFNKTLKRKVNEQTKELQEKNIHLQKLLIMRGEFLNIASHQLRTPVTVIKGMSDMLLNEKVPNNKRKKFLKGISQKAHKLSVIIHDILSAAEMDTEEFNLEFEKINIVELINKIIEAKKEEIEKNNLKLNFKPPKNKILILGNERYLEQAILNLINNSIQYTPAQGKITIKIEDKKEEIILRIADTGIGIPSKNIPQLFDKFVRAKNATKVYTDGSGLGLFIAKKIVEAHKNGKIYIEKTQVNKGTTFAIHLPKA
ncbi:MAG: GAF domain-containing protein, partial [Candidatus Moranbacteria bacterium]|nr:GAF domain-containing protein [Candidatus Moranbacteria bacterium]